MENDSTPDAQGNSPDLDNQGNQGNPGNASTESGTADDKNVNDNSDSSKSTDSSADDDNKSTNGDDGGTPAPKFDTDLDEWAEKTGRPKPENDRERALYQEIRDGQREYSRSKQAKDSTSEMDKALANVKAATNKPDGEEDDEEIDAGEEAKQMILEERHARIRSEYFSANSVTTEEAKTMGEILQEKVERAKTPEAKKQAYDYWTDPTNLEDWHALAKARLNANRDTTVIEEEAARKERERIAKESHASGGTRNATSVTEKKTGYNRTDYLRSDDY